MIHDYEPLIKDECSLAMKEPTKKAAQIIADAIHANKKILVRYHDDCDGVCSALLLESAIKRYSEDAHPVMKQGDSAVYAEEDAKYDFQRLEGEERPLIVLLDHGANSESLKGVAFAASFAGVLIIDHHPPHEETIKAASHYLGPFKYGGGSQHCAALLCHGVAQALTNSAEENYAWYALDADHSPLSKQHFKESVVIDYLAVTLERPKPSKYLEVLENPTAVQACYLRAVNAVKAALERAKSRMHSIHTKKFSFYLLDVDFLEKGGYPSKGKIVNAFQDEHEEEDCVSIAYGDTTALFRVSCGAHEKGFKANKFIDELKARLPNKIFSGGGHEQAASMRFKKGALNEVLEEIGKLIQTR